MLGSYKQLERLLNEGYINHENLHNREESCPYKPIFNCEECDGEGESFSKGKCSMEIADKLIELVVTSCPKCEGVLYPTNILTLECDSCDYREIITERELF
jgi:excinuclease UvrABC ATPase subunit